MKEIEEPVSTAKLPPGKKAVKELPDTDAERALGAIERRLDIAKTNRLLPKRRRSDYQRAKRKKRISM